VEDLLKQPSAVTPKPARRKRRHRRHRPLDRSNSVRAANTG
jgi:hypothetical protein